MDIYKDISGPGVAPIFGFQQQASPRIPEGNIHTENKIRQKSPLFSVGSLP